MIMGWDFSLLWTNNYFKAILILFGSLALAKILLFIFKTYIEKYFSKVHQIYEKQIFSKIELPIIIVIILVGFQLSIHQILSSTSAFENLLLTSIVIVITVMFMSLTTIVLRHLQKSEKEGSPEFHDEMFPLMNSLIKIIFVFVALLVILQLWGVKVGALLASLGVAGVILGFAFRDSLVNIFGGIALVSDDSFKKGDIVRLDSGEMGEVVEMGLRSTKIKTFDSEYLVIPNGLLATTKFINMARPTNTLRIVIPVSVVYGSRPEEVEEVLLEAIKGRSDVLKFPKREVRFTKMADYSLDFELIFYISDYKDMFTMKSEVTRLVYNLLNERGIEIPFPTRTIYSKTNSVAEKSSAKTSTKSSTKASAKTATKTPTKTPTKTTSKIFKTRVV